MRRVDRIWFHVARAVGWVLRSARYSSVDTVDRESSRWIRKRRRPHAGALLALGAPALALMRCGISVLGARAWHAREIALYRSLYQREAHSERDGSLLLPLLPGRTLSALLSDAGVDDASRTRAVTLATRALARLHHAGVTHGDAMTSNVLVDLDGGFAAWFDFETVHDARRRACWARADDLRALLMTMAAASGDRVSPMIRAALECYADDAVHREVRRAIASVWRRALPMHLGQAPLTHAQYAALQRLVAERAI